MCHHQPTKYIKVPHRIGGIAANFGISRSSTVRLHRTLVIQSPVGSPVAENRAMRLEIPGRRVHVGQGQDLWVQTSPDSGQQHGRWIRNRKAVTQELLTFHRNRMTEAWKGLKGTHPRSISTMAECYSGLRVPQQSSPSTYRRTLGTYWLLLCIGNTQGM